MSFDHHSKRLALYEGVEAAPASDKDYPTIQRVITELAYDLSIIKLMHCDDPYVLGKLDLMKRETDADFLKDCEARLAAFDRRTLVAFMFDDSCALSNPPLQDLLKYIEVIL